MNRRVRAGILLAFALTSLAYAYLAHARYATFHNETFDLALYARMSWGLLHGSIWDPITGAPYLGVHLAFVQIPLAWLGSTFGYVGTLLVGQAIMAVFAGWPIVRMASRRFGNGGALVAAAVWLLYPNLAHVVTDEFHPGTCAMLPLAWALDAFDRRATRELVWACVATIACREDLALVTFVLGMSGFLARPSMGRRSVGIGLGSAAYFIVFAAILVPLLGPKEGSLALHFGQWGGSAGGVVVGALTHPGKLVAHVFATERLRYLVLLFAPLLGLPLLAPRVLVAAVPLLLINLLSSWPTAIALDSHYQTTLLPILIASAVVGAESATRWFPAPLVAGAVLIAAGLGHAWFGGTPIARDWNPAPFAVDARARAAAKAVAVIPDEKSVQAPYALMPHLVEREYVRKPPPVDFNTDYVILDGSHRAQYLHDERLIRTHEEPVLRNWLGRTDFGLVALNWPFFVLKRHANPRGGPAGAYFVGTAFPDDGARITECLGVRGGVLGPRALHVLLVARGPCPNDLAVRFGSDWNPERVDLLFDGVLAPSHLERGDLVVSSHALSSVERERGKRMGFRIGAIRSSGARPDHADPISVPIPLLPASQ